MLKLIPRYKKSPDHDLNRKGRYTTNGITLADSRKVYPISDLPADDDKPLPYGLHAAKIDLKPIIITAKHPLWNLPDYQGKEDNLNINIHKDELYQNRRRREEAGKEYLKNIGRASLAIGTLPMLGYGAVTAPLATGLSLAGGEGLNYGINKLTPYDSWGNMLAEGVFNTENELAQTALEFTNPGFLLGFNAAPFINNQYRGLRVANELRKGVNSTKLQSKVTENPIHTRVKVGDVELGDPSTAYRQGSQTMVDDFLQTGTVRSDGLGATAKPRVEGKIFLGKNFSNPMFKQGNLWYGLPEQGDSRIGLLTTREPLQVATKSSAPDRVFSDIAGTANVQTLGLNAGRRIPLTETQLNLENTTPYLYEPNYGYRRVQEPIPTVEQAYREAINTQQQNPVVFARHLADEGINNILRDNYLEGSPSFALTKYSNDSFDRLSELYSNNTGITFLFGKNAAGNNAKYFVGDADTPIRQDVARVINLPATKEAINSITPEQVVLGKRLLHRNINSNPISFKEALNRTRENNFRYTDDFYNEVLLDKILNYRDAIGAIVNTNNPKYTQMLEKLNIPYGSSLEDIPFNFKGFKNGGKLGNII